MVCPRHLREKAAGRARGGPRSQCLPLPSV